MLIKPNKTSITATIIDDTDVSSPLKIVILSVPGKITLPKFLWAGRIVTIDRVHDTPKFRLAAGTIVSTRMEVKGDPFTQGFHLHSLEIISSEEE